MWLNITILGMRHTKQCRSVMQYSTVGEGDGEATSSSSKAREATTSGASSYNHSCAPVRRSPTPASARRRSRGALQRGADLSLQDSWMVPCLLTGWNEWRCHQHESETEHNCCRQHQLETEQINSCKSKTVILVNTSAVNLSVKRLTKPVTLSILELQTSS